MGTSVARRLIEEHLVEGRFAPGEEIALRVEQTLTQDATGTLVMLELEALGLDRVRTELSAQYVDHNLLQADHRNPDDHLFLASACRRFGLWFSRPGNGVSHPVHQDCFGRPGACLLGSDSHTCAAGALGMLAMGAGGLELASVMAGEPYRMRCPAVLGVRLVGEPPPWVSAKDVILELLRRHGVDGGLGRVVEYHGRGVAALSAMDRHVIANMGAELGATTSVFPSDEETRRFLASRGRAGDWRPLAVDGDPGWDAEDELDLSELEPLVALPTSPGNVVPVREVAGEPVYQCYVGSSANPGFRDFAVVARALDGRRVADGLSLDVNPSSRAVLAALIASGDLERLLGAGARLHQAGCNGCIGMGQAPASGRVSLRTVPRNFPGRSGTADDRVHLCSPETAAASALAGRIADPRELGEPPPRPEEPRPWPSTHDLLVPPAEEGAEDAPLVRGPDIAPLPALDPLPDALRLPVLLVVGDDLSTDEILPAGARVLPHRSNLPRIAEFAFEPVDPGYVERARRAGDHAVVGGANYGQGSSREHAALAPRYLGLRAVLALGFARIHEQNLANFGVLPLVLQDVEALRSVEPDHTLTLRGLRAALRPGAGVEVLHEESGRTLRAEHRLTSEQVELVRAGGRIPWLRARRGAARA